VEKLRATIQEVDLWIMKTTERFIGPQQRARTVTHTHKISVVDIRATTETFSIMLRALTPTTLGQFGVFSESCFMNSFQKDELAEKALPNNPLTPS
jgi:hypothetical protein